MGVRGREHERTVMESLDPIEFARLQRQTANSFERQMWELLRDRRRCNLKFRRQHPLGPWTADFYCAAAKLVIEVDGASHFTDEGKARDAARNHWMRENGVEVLRFSGKQVEFETLQVIAEIERVLIARSPLTPVPSPRSEQRGEG